MALQRAELMQHHVLHVLVQLTGFVALLGRELGVELRHRLGMDGRKLAHEHPLIGGNLGQFGV